MATRGRPRKDGKITDWMFCRAMWVLHAYGAARVSMKHSSAVTVAAAAVKEFSRGRPISETTAKRIVAQFRGKGTLMVFNVTKTPDEEIQRTKELLRQMADDANTPGLQEDEKRTMLELAAFGSKIKSGIRIGFGPRREYPRNNAKSL